MKIIFFIHIDYSTGRNFTKIPALKPAIPPPIIITLLIPYINYLDKCRVLNFFGWLFASQKTGFSGFRYRFIPSLRFGTGFASPYNPCHDL